MRHNSDQGFSAEAGVAEREAQAYDRAIQLFTEECRRQQCDLNERSNATVRFNRLPVEISARILFLVFCGSKFVLQRLLQVARYWRKLIHAAPRFWAKIANHDHPAVTSAFLRNSKSVPLSIFLCSSGIPFDNFFDLLYPHTSRLHTFDIRCVATHPGLDILLSTLPSLRRLSIEGDFLALLPSTMTPPSPILSLRHLTLVEVQSWCLAKLVDWLTSLLELRSIQFHDWRRTPEAMEAVLPESPRRVVSLPQLESVEVEYVPSSVSRALMASVVPTGLRRLEFDNLHPDWSCTGSFTSG